MNVGGYGGTTIGCTRKDGTNGGGGTKDEVVEVLGDVKNLFGGEI